MPAEALSRPARRRGRDPVSGARGEQEKTGESTAEGGQERGSPADPGLDLRDDGERDSAPGEPDATEETLRERGASLRSDVGTAGDERQPGPDTGQRARDERQSGVVGDQRDRAEGGDRH